MAEAGKQALDTGPSMPAPTPSASTRRPRLSQLMDRVAQKTRSTLAYLAGALALANPEADVLANRWDVIEKTEQTADGPRIVRESLAPMVTADGRRIPGRFADQLANAWQRQYNDGSFPAHPGHRFATIVHCARTMASWDLGSGAWPTLERWKRERGEGRCERSMRDVGEWACRVGLAARLSRRFLDERVHPDTRRLLTRARSTVYVFFLAPLSRPLSDDELADLCAGRAAEDEMPSLFFDDPHDEGGLDMPTATPGAPPGPCPAGQALPATQEAPGAASELPKPRRALPPELAGLMRLCDLLAEPDVANIRLDPVDVAIRCQHLRVGGKELSAPMILAAVEELTNGIVSGRIVPHRNDASVPWTIHGLRGRIATFCEAKLKDREAAKRERERTEQATREREGLAAAMRAAQHAAAATEAPAAEPPADDVAPRQETLERVIAERRAITAAAHSKGEASYRPPEDVQARLQALLAGRPPLPRPPPPS